MIEGWDIPFIYRALLVFVRLGALLFFMPFFSGHSVPSMAKLGFALGFSILVATVMPGAVVVPSHVVLMVMAMVSELLLGLFMGLIIRVSFQAVSFAGELWATEGNFMRDNSFDPMSQLSASAMERLLFNFAIVIFLTTGMHLQMFEAFVKSFDLVPVGQWWPNNSALMGFVAQTVKIFVVGIQIAAPVIAMNFVINMTFAILGKAAPQVNVFVISFAVLIAAGLILFSMTLDVVAQTIIKNLQESASNMLLLLQFK